MFKEGEKVEYVITFNHNTNWHGGTFMKYIEEVGRYLTYIKDNNNDHMCFYIFNDVRYFQYFKEGELKKAKKLLEDV